MANTVTVSLTGNPDIDGLLSGIAWAGPVTYSYAQSAADYPDYTTTEPMDGFVPLSVSEVAEEDWIASSLMQFTDLKISMVNTGGDIRLGHTSDANPAYTYYPGPGSGGDTWLGNLSSPYNLSVAITGTYSWYIHLHEMGHALGLKHSFEGSASNFTLVPGGHDALEFTVMSYRSFPFGPTQLSNQQDSYPTTFMMNDILALQTMYGANYTAHDDVYSWSPTQGKIFETIWHGGGHATYDFSNYTTNLNIDLRPGMWSITDSHQLAQLGNGLTAEGNIYNAYEFQGNPASLIQDAIGGAGDDIIRGNAADNHLTGGGGLDTFVFDDNNGHDTIMDFHAGDKIDLTNIPTITKVTDTFVGGATLVSLPGGDITVLNYHLDNSDFILAPQEPTITSFDIGGNPGFAYRLYQAAFDRAPDLIGLSVNVHLLNTSLTHMQVAEAFAQSPEFMQLHGNSSDADFLVALYHDVLGRMPDQAGLSGWESLLNNGMTRGNVLIGFSESQENHTHVDPALTVTGILLDPNYL